VYLDRSTEEKVPPTPSDSTSPVEPQPLEPAPLPFNEASVVPIEEVPSKPPPEIEQPTLSDEPPAEAPASPEEAPAEPPPTPKDTESNKKSEERNDDYKKNPSKSKSETKPKDKTNGKQKSKIPQRKTLFWLVTPIAILLFIGIFLSFSVPGVASLFGTVFYGITILIFFLFILLGIFVVFGFREQAGQLLQIFFEGGVKYIDVAQFFSDFWDEIIRMLQEFVLWVSPFLAVVLAFIFYYVVMYVFRYVATLGDVTVFTIVMTVVLASFTAGLSLSNFGQGEEDSYSFRSQFSFRFGRVFVDSIEIAVAIIFLTIDLRNPFFLPESLHGTVQAEGFGIDLMMRGVEPDGFAVTLRIAGIAVLIEIIRKTYRLAASMVLRYKELKKQVEEQGEAIETADEMFELLRKSSRIAFKDNLDDMTKFLGFTTVLVGVFFFFPRLKLVSLLFFNLTNLVWDIIVPSRAIKPVKSEDLFSRLIAKTFKL
jgi:hypothetical protein